jgi:pimeloyl-ACP methyl ester carboxylesterase
MAKASRKTDWIFQPPPATIKGKRMAHIDVGSGDAVVFQHGNPTSSICGATSCCTARGWVRLIACDLIGMGDSDKLDNSGPDRYRYAEQRRKIRFYADQSRNPHVRGPAYAGYGVRSTQPNYRDTFPAIAPATRHIKVKAKLGLASFYL